MLTPNEAIAATPEVHPAIVSARPLHLQVIIVLCVLWLIFVLSGAYYYELDPLKMDISASLQGPSLAHPLGCDRLGRDVLARLFHGAWTSLSLAVAIIALSLGVGVIVGLWCALRQDWSATLASGLMNTLLAFPQNLSVILIAGLLGVGLTHTVLALCLFWWVHFARITYCRTISILKEEYIRQARLSGESTWTLLRLYIMPQLKGQLFLTSFLDLSAAILTLSSLSFLGLSTQPPEPEWGAMLFENRAYLQNAPHLLVFPALFIFISALLCNLLGHSYERYHAQTQHR